MSRSRNSVKARRLCFEHHKQLDQNGRVYLICSCGCGQRFDPVITAWRADHARRHAEDGQETAENLWPILTAHDAGKGGKAAKDTSEVARGKRRHAIHYGIGKMPKGRPLQSRGFPKYERERKRWPGPEAET